MRQSPAFALPAGQIENCRTLQGNGRRLHYSDYLREEAAKYRQLAESAEEAAAKEEFLELAAVCEGDSGLREITMSSGTHRADELINEILSANPALPIRSGSARQHSLGRLKEKLGRLVTARSPYDDFRKPMPVERHNISNRLNRELEKRRRNPA